MGKTAALEGTDGPLDSLNGMRVISMTWVILCHTYVLVEPHLFRSALQVDPIRKTFSFQAILSGHFSVESFYVITSVLISYNIIKAYDEIGAKVFNVPVIFIKRLWRLLPSLLYLIGVLIVLPLVGSGPFWRDTMEALDVGCRKGWFYNALFINNFSVEGRNCAPHTWYLAVDFQLFILALVYLFLVFKKPIWGKIYLLLMVVIGITGTAINIYIQDLPPTTVIDIVDVNFILDYVRLFYALPHVHLGNYACGLALGTYLARSKKTSMSKKVALIGWALASATGLGLVYGVRNWNAGKIPTMVERYTFGPFQRTIWGICVCWVIAACAMGKGGFVNSLLSWKGFKPLVRISFMMYLMHIPVMMSFYAQRRQPIETYHDFYVWMFFGHLGVTIVASLGMRVIFEAPMAELERIVFKRLTGRKDQDSGNDPIKIAFNGKHTPVSEGIVNGSYTSNL